MKPFLLVDVDGVLNPYPDCPDGYREYDLFPGEEPVRLASVHGDWLRELSAYFDLAWATGWRAEANRLICPVLGLPELPVVQFPIPFELTKKVDGVAAFIGDRPAAWIDDIITTEAREWAERRNAPTFLVHVDSAAGLTRPQVDELLAWSSARLSGSGSQTGGR